MGRSSLSMLVRGTLFARGRSLSLIELLLEEQSCFSCYVRSDEGVEARDGNSRLSWREAPHGPSTVRRINRGSCRASCTHTTSTGESMLLSLGRRGTAAQPDVSDQLTVLCRCVHVFRLHLQMNSAKFPLGIDDNLVVPIVSCIIIQNTVDAIAAGHIF